LILFWILFNVFVVAMLVLDLGVFHRRTHTVKYREALIWSVVWITLAGIFAVVIYFWHGRAPSLEFVTGYVIELSLSVDNLFIFLLIFRYFQVPPGHQHKVLFWGILGALIMRAIFIAAGVGLIQKFHWIIYIFGAFLIYSGIKLFRQGEAEIHPEKNPVLRLFRRWVPVTKNYEGDKFFVRRTGLFATPLLVVLIVVETTDLLFAVDSIRLAFDVFCTGRYDGNVPLPALWSLGSLDVCWSQDADVSLLRGTDRCSVGCGGGDFAPVRSGLVASTQSRLSRARQI
jgi:tellurite resistance protein TerC